MSSNRPPAVLSIAGSDSGGGAGIQADLKAFAAAGVHGMTAITALTAQSTVAVDAVHQVPGEIIVAQVRAVADDIGVDAVKVGMLGDAETIAAVVEALGLLGEVPVVVDPVMVAESGAALLAEGARRRLVEDLLPLATVATPNLPEAAALSGLAEGAGQARLAAAVRGLGPAAAIVTGGHASGVDLLDDGSGEPLEIPGELYPQGAAHGSGCTHSSTLAALLARGLDLREAAVGGRAAAGRAVAGGLRGIGAGAGPVDVLGIGTLGERAAEPEQSRAHRS
jgi:hydroxymethylpyrimidine/phosphomethylpyrimidine kinase